MATSKTLAPTNVTISIPAMTDAPDASVFSNCVDKEADAINALNSQLETINFQYTFSSVSAGAGAIQTVSIPNPPSGKTLQLCTVNQSSGLNLVPVWISAISRGSNSVNVQVYNARTSATDVTVEIFALYW